MPASRPLRALLAGALLALGLVPATVAAADPATRPAPVQILPLTTSSGHVTEVGQAGLDQAASAPQAPASKDTGTQADAGTTDTSSPTTAPGTTPLVLTDPVKVDSFLVAGFRWSGTDTLPEGLSVYLRVRENGAWSPWYESGPSSAGKDTGGVAGSDEFVTGGADAVQVSVAGRSEDLPADLSLAMVPATPSGEATLQAGDLETTAAEPTGVATSSTESQDSLTDRLTSPATLPGGGAGTTSDTTDSTTGSGDHLTQPAVVGAGSSVGSLPVDVNTRADWGADPSVMTWDPEYVAAHHVVVHHTAGTNNYSAWQSASIVRGIYHYHAVVLDWGDIGYNFLVDKYGQVFEGRSGSLAAAPGQMVIGAHARGVNTGSMGISMLGDYSWVRPSDMTLDRVGKMAGWFLGRAGYTDVNQVAGILVRTTEKYQAGTVLNLPRIFGHRDSGNTACPGDTGYSMLGTIRSIAQDQAQISSRPSTNYLGWVHEGGSWYYFSSPGVMATGWVQVGENWYYLDPGTGAMVTGWAAVGSRWFYFRSDSGAMATGWIHLSSGWYYLDPTNGAMATGWTQIGPDWFYFDATGVMSTGWLQVGSRWFYLDPATGAMALGRIQVGSRWYYLDPTNGAMVTGWVAIGSDWYYFGASGAMATGWTVVGSRWFYFRSDSGAMATGWIQLDSGRYYLDPATGAMVTGWILLDSTWYYLDPTTGALVTQQPAKGA